MIVKEPEEGEEAMDVLGEGSSKEGGEEEKENRRDESLSESSREAHGATTRRKRKDSSVVLRRVRHPRAMKKMAGSKLPLHEKAPLSSPDIKLPQPTLGHSTPGDIGPSLPAPRRDSLFGFEALESPLVLSPVQSMSFLGDEESEHPSPTSVKKLLTYDIPLKKPTPRNRKQKKKGVS